MIALLPYLFEAITAAATLGILIYEDHKKSEPKRNPKRTKK